MNTKALAKLAELQARKGSLKSSLAGVEDEIKKLQEQLIPELMEEGCRRITVSIGCDENGAEKYRTVYLARTVRATHNGDPLALADAMMKAGLVEYVKPSVNLQQLSAYVREFDQDKNKSPDEIVNMLPKELHDAIKVSEIYDLKSTAA
jgi:hypothetical protein